MSSYNQPFVPALYFEAHSCNSNNSSGLPSELLSHCLVSYANWGDLAKLACVQRSWRNIVNDTAGQCSTSQWELATALFTGDCGLEKFPERAVQILIELSHVSVDEVTGKPFISEGDKKFYNNLNSNEDRVNYTSAMKKISACYSEGKGVPQDAKVSLSWLETAYYLGSDSDAAHKLALIFENGYHGIEVNVVTAAKWFERAADGGKVESMVDFGLCYELGCGVEQCDEKALDWYMKAANLGHPMAKFSVGEIVEARGLPQSDAEACIWYFSAAVDGCQDSKFALRRLYDIARIVKPGVTAILND